MTLYAGQSVVARFSKDDTLDLWHERGWLAVWSPGLWVARMPDEEIETIDWNEHTCRVPGAERERIRDLEVTAGDQITVDELAAFSGGSLTPDARMVAPALLMPVRTVVETEVTIVKLVRKARKKRGLRRKPMKNPRQEGE